MYSTGNPITGNQQHEHDSRNEEFLSLLNRSYRLIFRAILNLVPDQQIAEDIMQEICIVLWRKYDDFEPGTNFNAWSTRVAVNVTRSYLRNQKKQIGMLLPDETLALLARTHSGALELLELRRELLRECLDKVSNQDRELIQQSYTDGVVMKKVAKKMGLSENNLYVKLTRIRKRLMKCIERKMGSETE